ncbi:MAG TPA: IPT/TIG domain-containing protein, partial [Chloroflexota bacterium]|nr:IPT/TIG domain-containing protein [Chloroflexota bacterium]
MASRKLYPNGRQFPAGAARIGVCAMLATALLTFTLPISRTASAASLNVTGTWKESYHCLAGWCAGSDFPNTIVLSQKTGSSAVTGSDAGGATIKGTLSGHSLTITGTQPGYSSTLKVTISQDGKSWKGTGSDSRGTSGTTTATRALKLAVSSVSPNSGPASGTKSVTIHGSDFTGATGVSFVPQNGSPPMAAKAFSAVSDSVITATPPDAGGLTPPGPNGLPADVLVTSGGSTTTAGHQDVYTFLPPKVTGLNDTAGPVGGNTKLVITGSDFTGATEVRFKSASGTILATITVTPSSDTRITVNTPDLTAKLPKGANEIGTDIQVANRAWVSKQVAADQFTFSSLGVSS